jgi:pyruvate,water dikinase
MNTTLTNAGPSQQIQVTDAARFGVEIWGVAASPGRYVGRVCVIRDESEVEKLQAGVVLVWAGHGSIPTTLLRTAGALVTRGGGALSAHATIAREFSTPAVAGIGSRVGFFRDGQIVEIDGGRGTILVTQ